MRNRRTHPAFPGSPEPSRLRRSCGGSHQVRFSVRRLARLPYPFGKGCLLPVLLLALAVAHARTAVSVVSFHRDGGENSSERHGSRRFAIFNPATIDVTKRHCRLLQARQNRRCSLEQLGDARSGTRSETILQLLQRASPGHGIVIRGGLFRRFPWKIQRPDTRSPVQRMDTSQGRWGLKPRKH